MPHEHLTHPSAADLAARIPRGFLIGTATASAQIEGAIREGRRTPSVWDRFAEQPGRILDGSTTAVTADHFHRHAEDVALMSRLGADAYRFSLGWTRLQPTGSGPLDPEGVAFYDRLLDELHAAGVSPFATISHWDLPEEYAHGWLDRDTAARLGDFAALVGERFGDRVDAWITINEPATVTLNGYALGLHAPGHSLLFDALPTVHHQLLGHGLAVQALRAAAVRGAIGISNAHTPVMPASATEEDAVMAMLFDIVHNRVFADPVLIGRYPEVPAELADLFGSLADVPADDLAIIAEPIDFYGLNYYMPSVIAAGAGTGDSPDGMSDAMAELPFRLEPLEGHETTGFGWPIAPEHFETVLGQLRERYGDALPPVFITESGASFDDEVADDGTVADPRRTDYVARHLDAALRAVAPGGQAFGVDLRGFFVWSLLDNWEWAAGFTQRFGLVHVDFADGTRTPKESFGFLAEVNRIRAEA
ncbi:glycoside hydrolase family 1 protein [Microbacterium sp. ASV49]|uniref:Family 1 glycosylhydrolase n=1 Tax=Microbacterium candidum TaxID=3041922 RepID=A0ABT7MWX6_9MICO|nr:family 1 glycosylhydrolase [Microbacterium sp. ASV49]MDL9978955.1 family 1 glycosylhydrolase [Microbacterium sp. ASV49]